MTRASRLAAIRERAATIIGGGVGVDAIRYLLADIARLEDALRAAKRECGDDCYLDTECQQCKRTGADGYHCNCGARMHNARIDAALNPPEET